MNEKRQQQRPVSGTSSASGLDMESMLEKQANNLGTSAEEIMDTARSGNSTYDTPKRPKVDVPWCLKKLLPVWLPIKAYRFTAYRSKILQLLPQKILPQYIEHEKQGHYPACVKLLESALCGSLNVFQPNQVVQNKPLLIETVYQLLVGYVGLCLKNRQLGSASRLCLEMLNTMTIALKDLHPAHRTVVEACLFDTALSVTYYASSDVALIQKAETFFQQASQRYMHLNHTNRYVKCCLRYAAILSVQSHHHEGEYFIQRAVNKCSDTGTNSLLMVCYHNLAVQAILQQRLADSMSHLRTCLSLLKQLPKYSNHWMQKFDNTQWLLLKIQELWPQYQHEAQQREALVPSSKS